MQILFIYLNFQFQPNPSNGLVFTVILELGIWAIRNCIFYFFFSKWSKITKNHKFCKNTIYYWWKWCKKAKKLAWRVKKLNFKKCYFSMKWYPDLSPRLIWSWLDGGERHIWSLVERGARLIWSWMEEMTTASNVGGFGQ